MDVQKFIKAGEKLGLVGTELKAWAVQQAEDAREERAQAQEFESRITESERHNRELEREVLVRKLRLEALQTRISILSRAEENEGRAGAPNKKLASLRKAISKYIEVNPLTNEKTMCQVSRRDVQCDSDVEHMQAVICYHEPHHMGNAEDFSCPETLINEHNIFNSPFPLEKERADFQSHDMGNSNDILCSVVPTNEYSSPFGGVSLEEEIANISVEREYHISDVAKIVQPVIGTEHSIIEGDIIRFNISPITATEQPKCSEVERVAGLSARFLGSQLGKNASQVSPTSDIACVHLCRASPLMKTWRENEFKERLHSRQQQYKKRPTALQFTQFKWDAVCRQSGVERCFLNTLASESQTYWCHAAHRKFVRYKKSKAVHWQAAASVTHIGEQTSAFVLLCASHENFFWL